MLKLCYSKKYHSIKIQVPLCQSTEEKDEGELMCDFLKQESEGHVYGQPDIKSVSSHSVAVEMIQLLRGAAAAVFGG